jgi:zinc transport system permease protein
MGGIKAYPVLYAAAAVGIIFLLNLAEILRYGFMINALVAGVIAGVLCGIVSTYVVVRRVALASGGISHAAFGGVGLGYFLGLNPLLIALPFSLAATVLAEFLGRRTGISEDASLGILWAVGMSLGVMFIGLSSRGYTLDLMGYIFGNIFTVSTMELLLIGVILAFICLLTGVLYKDFMVICFDEEYGETLGLPVGKLNLILMGMVALTVIALIKVVGVLLAIALLVIPASLALKLDGGFKTVMASSTGLAVLFIVYGLWFSYMFNLPSGATIVPASAILFALTFIGGKLKASS